MPFWEIEGTDLFSLLGFPSDPSALGQKKVVIKTHLNISNVLGSHFNMLQLIALSVHLHHYKSLGKSLASGKFLHAKYCTEPEQPDVPFCL